MLTVTNYDKVPDDDFYLTDEGWIENTGIDTIKELRAMANNGDLFVAYEIDADTYAVMKQMDSTQVFVNFDGDIQMICEGAVIGNKHQQVWSDKC